MTPRELLEYRTLRGAIQQRGTMRIWLFAAGLTFWAILVIATSALASLPIATLLPLLVLAGVFEAVFALHTAVERIGRYLQVFYEEVPSERNWEHTAMAFGRAFPGGGTDPLFGPFFWIAALFNFVPAILAGPVAVEWVVTGAAHVLFIARVAAARHHAAGQRALDLERFQQLKKDFHDEPSPRRHDGHEEPLS
jgi:hypothetical protein